MVSAVEMIGDDMFCGKCGAQVADGAKFCNKCGNSFTEGGGAPAQPMYTQPTYSQPAYGTPQGSVAAAPTTSSKLKLTDPKVLLIGAAAIIIIVLALTLTLCSGGKSKIVGTWVSEEGYEMVFEKDGTMKFGAYGFYFDGEYTVKGSKLTVALLGESTTFSFKVSGNKMTLTQDDGSKETLTRKK